MGPRDRLNAALARQLSRSEGLRGRFVARRLNQNNRSAIQAAVEAAQCREGHVAADLGFGGGVGIELLLQRVGDEGHVHGVDLSETMVTAALVRYSREAQAGRTTLRTGSLTALPLDDGQVDAAITINTIYFVDDLPAAFDELRRVLRPSGRVVVGIGDPEGMARVPVTRHGFRLRPVAEVEEELSAAGLERVGHERVGEGGGAGHLLVWRRPATDA